MFNFFKKTKNYDTNTEKESSIIFSEKGIGISDDLIPIFSFLIEIEKEIKSILDFNKKLDGIKQHYLEMVDFVLVLSNVIKDNNLDFKFTFNQSPENIAEKLNFHIPTRSQTIILFASLEVLYFLHIAYTKEISDDDALRSVAMADKKFLKRFINEFLLSNNNNYYKLNRSRMSKLNSSKLRDLRNSLTHFFSVSKGISIAPSELDKEARNLEKEAKNKKIGEFIIISPDELFNLIKEANLFLLKKWSNDCTQNNTDFKRKISFVSEIVKRNAPVVAYKNNTTV
jgi:hypothetical protein